MIDKIIEKAVNEAVQQYKNDMHRIALDHIDDFYIRISTAVLTRLIKRED